jgi:hypothetical protein
MMSIVIYLNGFMNKKRIGYFGALAALCFLAAGRPAQAMPLGTILYRTSANGQMYGYNQKSLLKVNNGILQDIYSGHVGIYIGQENGEDYVVEAMADGVRKTPARYFVNTANGEKLIGAKIPKGLSEARRRRVVDLARALADRQPGYDFDFSVQKGPDDKQWICVGVTEKLYESADAMNAADANAFEYDPARYAIDITPDGFDHKSVYNKDTGDCFSKTLEFSRIAGQIDMLVPAPEIFGFDAGKEYQGERYFFLPYTQFLQPTLEDVTVDIQVASAFKNDTVRAKMPKLALLLRWSVINNITSAWNGVKTTIAQLWQTANPESGADWLPQTATAIATPSASVKAKKTTTVKSVKTKVTASAMNANDSASIISGSKKISGGVSVSSEDFNKTLSRLYKASSTSSKSSILSSKTISSKQESVVKTATADLSPYLAASGSYQEQIPAATVVNNYSTIVQAQTAPVRPALLIAEIGADWLALYNNSSDTVDLAESKVRLEKSKTAVDPSIALRFSESADVAYNNDSEIAPYGLYIIAAAGAPTEIKALAQAVAQRTDFAWGKDGYTLYLADGAVSTPDDADILDKVGWGAAEYFKGACPASALADNAWLARKDSSSATPASMLNATSYNYNSGNNCQDFVLVTPVSVSALDEITDNTSNNETPDNATDTPITDGNQTEAAATSTDEIIADDPAVDPQTDVATQTDAQIQEDPEPDDPPEINDPCPKILLSRIKADKDNEVVELFNPFSYPVDLAACGYRLEKAVTAVDPGLIARFDDPDEVAPQSGTLIPARGYYMLVAASSSPELRVRADALAKRDNFIWDGKAYTLYLGRDAISSDQDPDIVDKVGWGTAKYFAGSGPAPVIPDNAWLIRKAVATSTAETMAAGGPHETLGGGYDTGDNAADWILLLPQNSASDDQTDSSEPEMITPPGIEVSGLTHLWHFDECRGQTISDIVGGTALDLGNNHWDFGRQSCAAASTYPFFGSTGLQADFIPMNGNDLSISFDYRLVDAYAKIRLTLPASVYDNGDFGYAFGEDLSINFGSGNLEFSGLPNTDWRVSGIGLTADNQWHKGVLVVNESEDYWAIYNDGRQIYRRDLQGFIQPDYSGLSFNLDGETWIDEVAVFDRSVDATEISGWQASGLPFAPQPQVLAPVKPQLLGLWNFSEGYGDKAADVIGGRALSTPQISWQRKQETTSARQSGYLSLPAWEASLGDVTEGESWSLGMRWRNYSYPEDYRAVLSIFEGQRRLLGFRAAYIHPYYFFENGEWMMSYASSTIIPADGEWHHLFMTYDGTDFMLSFYVDGVLKFQTKKIWTRTMKPDRLQYYNDGSVCEVDDISWWRGALAADQVKALADAGPAEE